MFYVSSKANGLYGITDTEDGVEEFYSKEFILKNFKGIKIDGVTAKGIKVVNASKEVAQKSFDMFGDIVKRKIYSYPYSTCEELARGVHFVKQIKGLENNLAEVHRITYENIYPKSVQDVVSSAVDYTNNLIEVNCSSPDEIKKALKNNVCLVLQHKTNGALTAFICTASLAVTDYIYEPGFFDGVYLTKQLYGYTQGINNVRKEVKPKVKNPDLLNVFSCSLRFRREGVHHDGLLKELSSPFYSVNLPRVLGMFILDNPKKLGDRIIPEFYTSHNKDDYKFDFDMYREIKMCLDDGSNYFGNQKMFEKYIDFDNLEKPVELNDLIARFQDNFDYMERLRLKGYSF